mmetsp:Transcript_84597/g.224637  ORF Transcript_84597/g.224637 Transcript_84597/m.224637 type:complete len:83 (+) Transcript_84597:1316-1564(+)
MKGDDGTAWCCTAWCSTTFAKPVPVVPEWMLGPTRGVLLRLRRPRRPGDRNGHSIGEHSSSEIDAHLFLAAPGAAGGAGPVA